MSQFPEMTLEFGSNTPILSLQFAVGEDLLATLPFISMSMKGTTKQEEDGREKVGGSQVFRSKDHTVSLLYFVGELHQAGYVLVAANYSCRPVTEFKRSYFANFTFYHPEHYVESLWDDRGAAMVDLLTLCTESHWKSLDAYENPYFRDDKVVEDWKTYNVVFGARDPVYRDEWVKYEELPDSADGRPVRVETKDENGNPNSWARLESVMVLVWPKGPNGKADRTGASGPKAPPKATYKMTVLPDGNVGLVVND